MKKAVIYIFTGTGNTRCAAELIAEALRGHDIETTIWEARVPLDTAPDPNAFDMALFGYPVYAYNTPRFFLRFVKTLPRVGNKPAYIFKTSGEPFGMNNVSSRALVGLLRKKGFVPMREHHLLMPYNIMFRYSDALAKQMYLHTKDMAEVVAGGIESGSAARFHYHPLAVLLSYLFRLQWFGAFLNGPLVHVNKSSCTGCGLCVKICPAQNVSMRGGYPRFGAKCTMCMGCAFLCPQDAVRPGLLSLWRVNGPYHFKKLAGDDSVPSTFIDENTRGYFRLFRPYYERTNKEIAALRAKEKIKASSEVMNERNPRFN
jgi:NAD-dependent dihydropyrimidine dehydrogenase PreA subunit